VAQLWAISPAVGNGTGIAKSATPALNASWRGRSGRAGMLKSLQLCDERIIASGLRAGAQAAMVYTIRAIGPSYFGIDNPDRATPVKGGPTAKNSIYGHREV
jgi:hypothetical protein